MIPDSLRLIYKAAPLQLQVGIYLLYAIFAIALAIGIKFVFIGIKSERSCKLHTGLNDTVIAVNTALDWIKDTLCSMRKESKDAREYAQNQRNAIFEKIDILDKRVDDHETRLAIIEADTKCKILKKLDAILIDDDDMVRKTYKQMLEELDFNCYTAKDRDEAEAMLKSKPFDLAMIDLCLANGERGLEIYKYCKNAYKNMKYIIYSGQSPEKIPTEISNIFLEKPIMIKTLKNKLNEMFGS